MDRESKYYLRDLIDSRQLEAAKRMMGALTGLPVVVIDLSGRTIGRQNDGSAQEWFSIPLQHRDPTRIIQCSDGLQRCISPVVTENVCLGAVLIGPFHIVEQTSATDPILGNHSTPAIPSEALTKLLRAGEFMADYLSEIALKGIALSKLQVEIREKLRYAEETQKAQLQTLSAQINPHFLFNTLNSITRMAYLEDAHHTQDMTYCLSDLLRYNLKQTEEFPTIGSEIENIRRYLHIQDIRYQDRIRHHIDIPSHISDCRIPSMLLQPIVENAIIHGLEPKIDGGSISITSEVCTSQIKLCVRDTGVGIKPGKLKRFFTDGRDSNVGLGIYNSHQRLQRYFGTEYGIKISSQVNVETVVEICLPRFKELAPLRTH